jgi:GxxExxY protein
MREIVRSDLQLSWMIRENKPFGHELTHTIIGGFFEAYTCLGYGLLETVYAPALRRELESRGLFVEREAWIDVLYKAEPVARQRIDMLVNHSVIVEIKATEEVPPFARRQLLNCLCATRLELDRLLHFGPEPKVYRLVDTGKNSTQMTQI